MFKHRTTKAARKAKRRHQRAERDGAAAVAAFNRDAPARGEIKRRLRAERKQSRHVAAQKRGVIQRLIA